MGQVGKYSDGGVFSTSKFGQAFDDNQMLLPDPTCLPGTTVSELPYVMVGDEAFPLRNYLLRPYPGRNLPGDSKSIKINVVTWIIVVCFTIQRIKPFLIIN